MRVLHLIPRFSTGGAEHLVLSYAQHMRDYGVEPLIASTVDGGDLERAFYNTQILTFVFSRQRDGGRAGALIKLLRVVWREKPDIIHTHLLGADIVGFVVRILASWNIHWVVTLHNVEHRTSGIRRFVWRCVLRFTDRVISVAPKVTVYSEEAFSIHAPQLITIPNGISLTPWMSVPIVRSSETFPLEFATIGRLEEQKGHMILLEALSSISFPFVWHIFGEGSLRAHLEEIATQKGINSSIRWHGVEQDMPQALKTIPVIVQPSLWEGLSLVIMEAMAAGRAVIATEPAAEGLVDHGINGVVVPALNSVALREALVRMNNEREILKTLGQAARKKAQVSFGLEQNITSVVQIYRELSDVV